MTDEPVAEETTEEPTAPTEEELEKLLKDVLEIPIINASIDVTEIESAEGEKGKAIVVTAAVGIVVGGLLVPPRPVRFVIPMSQDAATEVATELGVTGKIIPASMADIAKIR